MFKTRFEIILVALGAALLLAGVSGVLIRACQGGGALKGEGAATMAQGGSGAELAEFSPFPRFRVGLAGKEAPVLVAEVVLLLPSGDKELREEVLGKRKAMAGAIEAFLSTKTEEDLLPAFEGTLKAELRDLVNSFLVLGAAEGILLPLFSLIE